MSQSPTRVKRKCALALGIAIILALAATFPAFARQPFDSTNWKAFHSNYTGGQGWSMGPPDNITRARMVEDLLRSRFHAGMSPAEGRDLLGEPESEGGGSDYQVDSYALTYRSLLTFPSILLRWGTDNPHLYVRYESRKLVKAWVE